MLQSTIKNLLVSTESSKHIQEAFAKLLLLRSGLSPAFCWGWAVDDEGGCGGVRLRALWKNLCAWCGCQGQACAPQPVPPRWAQHLLWASWHILWALLGWAGRAQGMCFALPSQAVLAREPQVQMWGVTARDPGQVVPAPELSASGSSWPGPGVHCSDSSRGEGYPCKGWGGRRFQSWCSGLGRDL